jgi:galactonate dehydratase
MKIVDIKPFLVDRYLLVRVYTDQGLVGNGEAGLWAHHSTVREAIRELSQYYVGKDPRRIEHHHQVVSRDTHFSGAVLSAAVSAIDVALWDILGKSVNLPVYQLLGGRCRDRVRVFANVVGATLQERVQSARNSLAQGFTSLRMVPFVSGFEQETPTHRIAAAVEMVGAVREAIGDGIDLGLEIHRNLRPEEAITLAREIAPFRILYYEDPLPPESIQALEYLSLHVDLPMATGERFCTVQQFKELMDRKTVSLIRPDVSLAGGFTQARKIAAIAEASFVGIFPHLMGSPVNNAVFTQFGAATPNFVLMESNVVEGPLSAIVHEQVELRDGYRIVPDRPGIGVEIDEAALGQFPYRPHTITGSFHSDGSVAH